MLKFIINLKSHNIDFFILFEKINTIFFKVLVYKVN